MTARYITIFSHVIIPKPIYFKAATGTIPTVALIYKPCTMKISEDCRVLTYGTPQPIRDHHLHWIKRVERPVGNNTVMSAHTVGTAATVRKSQGFFFQPQMLRVARKPPWHQTLDA
jgi:hypothetical protein